MKKTFFLSALFLASAALAETAQTANVFGLLRINSTAKETIIGIPWIEPGVGENSIYVTNIIKTANLAEDDKLYYYSSGSYTAWQLDSNKIWQPAAIVTDKSTVSATAAADQATLQRGNALVLVRGNTSKSNPIYLYGQVASSSSVMTTLAKSSTDADAWTLLAPPAASDGTVDLNTSATWSNVSGSEDGKGDMIVLQNGTTLFYHSVSNKWGKFGVSGTPPKRAFLTTDAKVDAGYGIWYVSAKGDKSNAPSVTWSGMPSTGN